MVVWRKRQENFKEGNAIKHISRKTLKKSCGFCFSIKLLFSQVVLILRETLFTCFTWNDMMPSISKNQGVFKINVFSYCFPRKRKSTYRKSVSAWLLKWTSLGLNQGPPDYETNRMIVCDISLLWTFIDYQHVISIWCFVACHWISMTQTVCLRIVYAGI